MDKSQWLHPIIKIISAPFFLTTRVLSKSAQVAIMYYCGLSSFLSFGDWTSEVMVPAWSGSTDSRFAEGSPCLPKATLLLWPLFFFCAVAKRESEQALWCLSLLGQQFLYGSPTTPMTLSSLITFQRPHLWIPSHWGVNWGGTQTISP